MQLFFRRHATRHDEAQLPSVRETGVTSQLPPLARLLHQVRPTHNALELHSRPPLNVSYVGVCANYRFCVTVRDICVTVLENALQTCNFPAFKCHACRPSRKKKKRQRLEDSFVFVCCRFERVWGDATES